ncbi:MAG TPA: alpha/beta fold hydrolase [Methylomirabilota bacterium]|nr:alpha/beta fold hydrolase [Methylomirabilota bacterium]
MTSARVVTYLGLILLLATVARVPGLFWGYHLFGTEVVVLDHDELPSTLDQPPTSGYPRGLEVHVRVLTAALEQGGLADLTHWPHYGFFVGRGVSLVYGLLTLLVVFRLARALFASETVGLLAALFLALADLHVTYSHLAVPDSAATFWFYAALASAHTALARGSRGSALRSAICTGVAASLRLQPMSLIPLAWWVSRSRRRVLDALLVLAAVALAVLVGSGLSLGPGVSWERLVALPEWRAAGLKRLLLPLAYLAVLLVGVGLPVFLLAAYGVFRFVRLKWAALRLGRDWLADDQVPFAVTALAASLQAATLAVWAPRQAVVLVPFVAMFAAYGFVRLPRPTRGPLSGRAAAAALVAVIAVYLAVQVASVQSYFVEEPLERAGRWLRARVPPGEFISVWWAWVPPEYPTLAEWKANYLVLSAQGYRRPLFEDGGNPKEARRVRQLFAGELPYRLVKKVGLRFYTPELLLTHAVWYPPPHVDEVLIYERQETPERAVALLTPLRTDYLLTLDTGGLWHPAPDQAVRLLVNGEPLARGLAAGVNHVLVPQRLVTSPFSELRLSSDRPLPHLPPAFPRRVRPLGREFAIETLLDDDLLAEGFGPPEIEPTGAVWRGTAAAARVLLPAPGSGGPWTRLAVRLRGRAPDPRSPVVAFALGTHRVGETAMGPEARTIEFSLPTRAFTAGPTPLDILTLTTRWPEGDGARDPSPRGVGVYWVRLSRGTPVPRFDDAGDRDGPAWRPLVGVGRAYRTEAVTLPGAGLTLRADLFIPAGGGRSAIVLAHGASPLGRKHALYQTLARRLAGKGYWVLAPDFRGYGESERPARIASAADLDYPRDLAAAIAYLGQRLGARDVAVVGHSFGADVAIALAARDPRVGTLVAISPARRVYERLLGSPAGRQLVRERMAAEMGISPAELPLELVEPIVAPITIDNYLAHAFRPPVLLVDGELEAEGDLRFLRDVYRRLRATKAYVTIPNADHYFGIQRQLEERDPVTLDALADVIDGWIREGATWTAASLEAKGA